MIDRIKSRKPTNIDKLFGVRFRTLRMQQGISQTAIAAKLGVTFQQVQKYESGRNRLSLARAVEAAAALNTTVNELTGVEGTPVAFTAFNIETFKLAQALERLRALSPPMVAEYRRMIDKQCEALEARGGKKRRK